MNSRRAGPPPPVPRGDGPARKESLNRARARVRAQGSGPRRRRYVLAAQAGRASRSEIRGDRAGGNVQHRGGGLPFSSGGRAAGHGEKIGELVAEFASGANEAGAIGWAQPRGAGFGMDGFQFPASTQHHPAGQGEPRDRQDRFIAFHPPLQALRACVGSHGFKLRHGYFVAQSKKFRKCVDSIT